MTTYTATYSPDDNKLRLYASSRLDKETYDRIKAAGFRWAPKQDLFVAPMWTPEREDLLIELAGEVDDEDKSLVDRAEERADRFDNYSDKRAADAERARKAVDAICDGIPMGQPILVGHHSERHARRDQERIESGMRKAVKMWETSGYWKSRAAGALQHAKYKELPAVRHRRIKGLESDKRRQEKRLPELREKQAKWLRDDISPFDVYVAYGDWYDHDAEQKFIAGEIFYDEVIERKREAYVRAIERTERWIAHYENRLTYERAMLNEQLGSAEGETNAMAARFDLKPGGKVLTRDGWLTILRVNKVQGVVNSVTTVAPSAVHWTGRWKYEIERIKDYQPPTEEQAAKVKKATALAPLCNYPGEGFREMTQAEWDKRNKFSDFPYIAKIGATETAGRHRRRQMPKPGQYWKSEPVFITDAKRVDPPAPEPKPAPIDPPAPAALTGYAAPQPSRKDDPRDAEFKAIKDSLKAGVQVVVAPQLFPTPADVAGRVVDLADIRSGHTVLEPSAGTGAIVKALRNTFGTTIDLTAVEIKANLAETVLRGAFRVPTHCKDFLECNGELGTFDRIVMNPPFERGSDIRHIEHALTFLKPGGRLVAICANGPRQQEQLQSKATAWIDLPAGTFKDQGTMVNTAIVVIDR